MSVDALKELLAKVEGDEIHDTGSDRFSALNNGVGVYVDHQACNARDAFFGSLDAAKALHEAVFPMWQGWNWLVRTDDAEGAMANVFINDADGCIIPETSYATFADDPARALLQSILKALIAQGEAA